MLRNTRILRTTIEKCHNLPYQFVIFKPLTFFEERIGFDVKTSFASRPLSRLIRWYNKPGDITKEFWEKAIQFHGTFHGRNMAYLRPEACPDSCLFRLIQAYSDIFNKDSYNNINIPFFTLILYTFQLNTRKTYVFWLQWRQFQCSTEST